MVRGRIVVVFLVLAVILSAVPAAGHAGPGKQPGVQVHVEIVSIAPDSDEDDGGDGDAELDVTYTIENENHGTVTTDPTWGEWQYDWDTHGGSMMSTFGVSDEVYTHKQCRFDGLELSVDVVEDDAGWDDSLGSDSHTFEGGNGNQNVATTHTFDTEGAKVKVRVTVSPLSSTEGLEGCDPQSSSHQSIEELSGSAHALATTLQQNPDLASSGLGGAILGNQRINVEVGDQTVGVVTDGQGRFTDVGAGPVENPTLRVGMSEATAEDIAAAENPRDVARTHLAHGDISYSGIGTLNRAGTAVLNACQGAADVAVGIGHAVSGFARGMGVSVGL